ncbi:hypothetical protein E2C01_032768 [Portunus trituberculatus]|uniref:Uncharacterized protein n=1 Tax=Portunus trituberculatus TaxID=210409 RepID=A0A5B7F217_PORTR|nr:hypothetical protein [Portunus trituberculatus]
MKCRSNSVAVRNTRLVGTPGDPTLPSLLHIPSCFRHELIITSQDNVHPTHTSPLPLPNRGSPHSDSHRNLYASITAYSTISALVFG